MMTEGEFWSLIALIDRSALESGDEDAAVEPLIDALSGTAEDEIRQFEDRLARLLYDIDGKAYADQAGESGQSDDGFLYVRCYVVASGEQYYKSVTSDPAAMPKSVDQWCESLLYVGGRAWAIATDNDEAAWRSRAARA